MDLINNVVDVHNLILLTVDLILHIVFFAKVYKIYRRK